MESWVILLSLIIILISIYYLFPRQNYLEKNGIIHTRGLPFLGHTARLIFGRNSPAELGQELYNLHPEAKYVGSYEFTTPMITIRDPEVIKSVAIKHFDHFVDRRHRFNPDYEPILSQNLTAIYGDKWRKVRALLSPAFTSSKLKNMFKLMSNCAENFADFVADETKNKPITYNAKDAFARYTNDVIATFAFGITIDSMKNPENDFYVLGKKAAVFEVTVLLKMMLIQTLPAVAKLLGIHMLDKKIEKFFAELIQSTIEMRDREGINRPDMIQLMMEARNNEKGQGSSLNILEMTSQAFQFFGAGYDTISSTMCFMAHHIANDSEVQRKLQEEVDEVYENCNGDCNYEVIKNLPYMEAVLNETLRMYPIAPAVDRECTQEFELPPALPEKKPVVLKPGDSIWLPIYALHRDPKYFPDPEKFYPQRFIEDPQNTLHSPAFMPFGVGPRMCIGNRFAVLAIKVLFFQLILKCTLKVGEKMILPLRLDKSSILLLAKGGFWLTLEPRNK